MQIRVGIRTWFCFLLLPLLGEGWDGSWRRLKVLNMSQIVL